MTKRKICAVVTARPSYSRVKTALLAIKEHPKLELQLVVAGSALLDRYGNTIDFIEKDGFTISEKVFMVLEGENKTAMAKTTGLGVMELANVFYNLQPDAVITIADRFETIATSIAAAIEGKCRSCSHHATKCRPTITPRSGTSTAKPTARTTLAITRTIFE